MDNLHKRIKSTRVSLGLSQAILAKKTGVSQPTVANWETGSHIPRQAVLEKIAKALNVSALWLLSGTRESDDIPASLYLQTPIRHIPVYRQIDMETDAQTSLPVGYLPYASQHPNLFGLMARQQDTQNYQITICNPDSVKNLREGDYVIAEDGDIRSASFPEISTGMSADILGRVIAEMNFFT